MLSKRYLAITKVEATLLILVIILAAVAGVGFWQAATVAPPTTTVTMVETKTMTQTVTTTLAPGEAATVTKTITQPVTVTVTETKVLTTTVTVAKPLPPIKIGFTAPMTGAGAFYGQQAYWGAQMAFDEINAKGGVLGRQLTLIVEDHRGAPAEAVSAVEKLINIDQVCLIIGTFFSSPTLAVMPIVEKAGVVLIDPVASSPLIYNQTGARGNKWVFKPNPSDTLMVKALAKFIFDVKGYRSISLIAEDTDFGRGVVNTLEVEAAKYGVKVLSKDFVERGATDFTAVLTKIKGLKPDAIGLGITGTAQIELIVKQSKELGIRVPLSGRYDMFAPELKPFIEAGEAEGFNTVTPYSPLYEGGRNPDFVKAFRARTGQEPHWNAFLAYEAAYIVAKAIEKAGSDDRSAIRSAMEGLEYESVTGLKLKFDQNNQMFPYCYIIEVKDRKLVVQVIETAPLK
jgi:branched-chain amino acid transport system substrate-binding protein